MNCLSFIATSLVLMHAFVAQNAGPTAFPKRVFNHDGKFTTEYDAKENTTLVLLEPVFVDAEKKSLRLGAAFEHTGKVPNKPKHISLAFYALYAQCKFSSEPGLTMRIDGELIKFGYTFKSYRERQPDEEGVAVTFNEMEGDRCNEVLAMFISQKHYLKLANAVAVEVEINGFRFNLTETNLEALRDLASRMMT